MTRHDVLRIVILALLVAVVIHVLTIRRAPAASNDNIKKYAFGCTEIWFE